MLTDYHQKPSSPKYFDSSFFFPFMMNRYPTELPLISYLKEANTSFFWSGNAWGNCNSFSKNAEWSCINSANNFSSRASYKFYLTTPLPKIYESIFNKTENLNKLATDKVLKYIEKNGLPETPFFVFIHNFSPHSAFTLTNECEPTDYFDQQFEGYKASYHCALKTVKTFMEKINNIDPEAIVVFQADHGWFDNEGRGSELDLIPEKEKYLLGAKIFNAIKAPKTCFDKYGLPTTNVNTIRFTLNCAYGFKLPYRKNIHYLDYGNIHLPVQRDEYGTVVEKNIYE